MFYVDQTFEWYDDAMVCQVYNFIFCLELMLGNDTWMRTTSTTVIVIFIGILDSFCHSSFCHSTFWLLIFYRVWILSSGSTPFFIKTNKILIRFKSLFKVFSLKMFLLCLIFYETFLPVNGEKTCNNSP